ncbi:MAG: replication-associated recombination protein A [Desulfobacteraceae bacterium]|jgi:putative ATPase
MDLFDYQAQNVAAAAKPLAEKLRPVQLNQFKGQQKWVATGRLLRRAIEEDRIFSMILWGPPGCGKTTIARIIAAQTKSHFIHFSAVMSGVKDIRAVIESAKEKQRLHQKRTILFVDEIHRFNKAQQDAFLHHVESGLITLIGATTENPSFEVITPLLSRCRVITFEALTEQELGSIIDDALVDKEHGLGDLQIELDADARYHLIQISQGDARAALSNLEVAAALAKEESCETSGKTRRKIGLAQIETALQKKALAYDKDGEEHYNLISAFHKSLRGSDPDAALYWLARMLEAGEDPLYVARRMVRFASEDVGLADPHALVTAVNAMEAFKFIGKPEGELALAQAAVYLATATKSNAIYTAYGQAKKAVMEKGALPVPLHIRNAPTQLMKQLDYGKGYRYAHDYKDGYVPQEYLPDALKGSIYYHPTQRGYEKHIHQRLSAWREQNKNRGGKNTDEK